MNKKRIFNGFANLGYMALAPLFLLMFIKTVDNMFLMIIIILFACFFYIKYWEAGGKDHNKKSGNKRTGRDKKAKKKSGGNQSKRSKPMSSGSVSILFDKILRPVPVIIVYSICILIMAITVSYPDWISWNSFLQYLLLLTSILVVATLVILVLFCIIYRYIPKDFREELVEDLLDYEYFG
jgi:magnesium-transporting ATPase (P-type)